MVLLDDSSDVEHEAPAFKCVGCSGWKLAALGLLAPAIGVAVEPAVTELREFVAEAPCALVARVEQLRASPTEQSALELRILRSAASCTMIAPPESLVAAAEVPGLRIGEHVIAFLARDGSGAWSEVKPGASIWRIHYEADLLEPRSGTRAPAETGEVAGVATRQSTRFLEQLAVDQRSQNFVDLETLDCIWPGILAFTRLTPFRCNEIRARAGLEAVER